MQEVELVPGGSKMAVTEQNKVGCSWKKYCFWELFCLQIYPECLLILALDCFRSEEADKFWCCCWSPLYSAVLYSWASPWYNCTGWQGVKHQVTLPCLSWADSLHSCCMWFWLTDLAFLAHFSISTIVVYLQCYLVVTWLVPRETPSISTHSLCKYMHIGGLLRWLACLLLQVGWQTDSLDG